MTAYLQRLLGRAAGLAAAPAAGNALRPILQSQSPVVGFDQRLADPVLAEDFAIVGATPEGGESGESLALAEPVAADPSPDAARPAPSRRRGTRQAAPTEEPAPARARDPVTTQATVSPSVTAEPTHSLVSEVAPRRPSAAPEPLAVQEATQSVTSRPTRRSARQDRPAEPPARGLAPEPAIRSEAAARTQPLRHQSPGTVAEAAAIAPRRDASPVASAPLTTTAFAPQPLPRQPEPVALPLDRQASGTPQPILAPDLPLPPLPQAAAAPSRAEIEQIVRQTVAAERAAAPAPAAHAAQRLESGADPARRPMSAAEASVIGKLESSAFHPMLFGVRRR